MMTSLQDSLPIIYLALDNNIVTSNNWVEISSTAKILPGIPTVSDVILECRLTKELSNTDISIAFSKDSKDMVSRYFDTMSKIIDTSLSWEKVDKLVKKWVDKNSVLYGNIESIWLEFDANNTVDALPEPSVFFAPFKSVHTEIHDGFARYNWVIPEVLEWLMPNLINNKTRKCLENCFDFLPVGSSIAYVGVMLPRKSESNAVRLCVQHISILKVIDYLTSVGWVDLNKELEILLIELAVFTDYVVISLSIDNIIQTKIGIECYIDKQPNFTSKWQSFFDFLVRRNLCIADKSNSLLEWPGYTEEKSCREQWPENLSSASTFVNSNLRSAIVRTINHIKIVYQPLMPLEAKAYLWFGHRWIKNDGKFQCA